MSAAPNNRVWRKFIAGVELKSVIDNTLEPAHRGIDAIASQQRQAARPYYETIAVARNMAACSNEAMIAAAGQSLKPDLVDTFLLLTVRASQRLIDALDIGGAFNNDAPGTIEHQQRLLAATSTMEWAISQLDKAV